MASPHPRSIDGKAGKPPAILHMETQDEGISKESLDHEGSRVDLDETELFLRQHNITHDHLQELLNDADVNKRLVRKIDLALLPLLCGTFMLQFIDKQALSYAAVFDLFTNTKINQTQYSWFASIFYFAYLIAEYPWVVIAQKTRMAKVVGGCVMAWGSVLMVTAACSNFAGLAVCRFWLGWFEAPITTCFMMIVSMWYTRQRQPFRAGIFYSFNGLGSMLGGVLTYAIGQNQGFPTWKAVFLVCGGITVVWGAILLYFLPDDILSAKRLTVEEKALLIARGRLARTGILNKTIKWYQIREAFIDPQVWLLVLFMLLNETVNGGITNFGKLIVKGLVSDPLKTVALGIPYGAFGLFWILSATFLASRFKNVRTIVMAAYLVPTILGTTLMWTLDRKQHKIGVLFAYYIVGGYVGSLVLALQMPSSNVAGYTKRMTASAMVFTAYCVGNIIGPHAFLDKEQPTYPTGCKVVLACSVTQWFVAAALRILLVRRNKKRDEMAAAMDMTEDDLNVMEGTDATDFENLSFRYVL